MRIYAKKTNRIMEAKRERYISSLLERRNNGLIKIVTGVRRCGKSYLLFNLFKRKLMELGVREDHIISFALDDYQNREYLRPDNLNQYVRARIVDNDMYYILLDEIQLVPNFEYLLNGFLHIPNADTYVTGSNSKFLSSDIITEFRGRGDEVRVYPLSFSEFLSVFDGTESGAWNNYQVYGGMPGLLSIGSENRKATYLQALFSQTYFQDIISRYNLRGNEEMEELMNVVASNIGTLTNPLTLTNTFISEKKMHITRDTVASYLQYMQDAFLIEKAQRYDVRGRHYIGTPMKYYFVDVGLRNARLNFRQNDYGHIMENVIYNELRMRGMSVDVGMVEVNCKEDGKSKRKQFEVDFVCNRGSQRYYIQSAYALYDEEKRQKEIKSLRHINDSFRKILVQKEPVLPYYDDNGFLNLSLLDFLTDETVIDK